MGSTSLLALPDEAIDFPHHGKNPSKSKLDHRLGWARSDLKLCGYIDNSERGVWSLTPAGMHTDSVALDEVVQGRVSGRQNTRDRLETTEDGEPSETENAVWMGDS